MDRNTLLAFFLIAIVLIFTPKYMEMVAPAPQSPPLPAVEGSGDTTSQTSGRVVVGRKNEPVVSSANPSPSVLWSSEEKIVTIENELYTADVSSNGGGSFLSFSFKNYLTADSQYVNLINGKNKDHHCYFVLQPHRTHSFSSFQSLPVDSRSPVEQS